VTIAKYIRLSVEDSKSDSMSIKNQRLLLDGHIKTLNIPNAVIIEEIDNGNTGTNYERPGIQRILERVRAGEIDILLIKDFSRLGRNSIETGYLVEMVFPIFKTRLISVSDGFDSDEHKGDTGGLEVAFTFLMHEFYSKDLSKKIKFAKNEQIRRGEYYTHIPFGYVKQNGKLAIDEPKAGIVCEIFSLKLDGKSAVDISKIMSLKADQVRHILADEQYTGTYVAGKTEKTEVCGKSCRKIPESEWVKIPNHHPPIISNDTFERVQAMKRQCSPNRKPRKPKLVTVEPLAAAAPSAKPADIAATRSLYERLVLGEIDADTYRASAAR
jgi:DNA invertase Pin-like site-specific DNA recombinase